MSSIINTPNYSIKLPDDRPIPRSVAIALPSMERALMIQPIEKLSKSLPKSIQTNIVTKSLSQNIWDVQSIPVIPNYYPLERTHILVQNGLPNDVARRISECMKSLSIAAEYDEKKAKARAKTSKHTKFTIQLFSKPHQSGILVEAKRASGCTINFHKTCYPILRAANGEDPIPRRKSFPSCKHLSFLPALQQTNIIEDFTVTIEMADNLLKKDRIDANLLGMESLHSMTESASKCPKATAFVANVVLRGQNGYENIRDCVRSLIEHWVLHEADDFDNGDEIIARHNSTMRNHALAIISNSLEVLSVQNSLQMILNEDMWYTESFIPMLLQDLNAADERPHDAVLSAKSLSILMNNSELVKERAMLLNVDSATFHSFAVGHRCHHVLANESKRLLSALNCS